MMNEQSTILNNIDSIDELKECLSKITKEYDCDEVKVYYISGLDYCVKLIKGEAIVKCFRRGKERAKNDYAKRKARKRIKTYTKTTPIKRLAK